MKARGRKRARKDPARQLLGMAISLTGMAGVLLVLSFALGNSNRVALQAVAKGLRTPVWYAFVFGILLLATYWVIRRKREALPPIGPEPTSSNSNTVVPFHPRGRGSTQTAKRFTHAAPGTPATTWTAQVFSDIEWRRFEAVCETLFAQAGFDAQTQSHGADGGVDIWLYSRNAEGPAAVVQCKHWNGRQVGVKQVREFYGVMASHQLTRGTYATTSAFTDDALRFAKQNGINAMDGSALLALIGKRTPEQQNALLQVAYEGEYWRPTCASCGMKMVQREPKKGGASFWGCVKYPHCKSTLPMRAEGSSPV